MNPAVNTISEAPFAAAPCDILDAYYPFPTSALRSTAHNPHTSRGPGGHPAAVVTTRAPPGTYPLSSAVMLVVTNPGPPCLLKIPAGIAMSPQAANQTQAAAAWRPRSERAVIWADPAARLAAFKYWAEPRVPIPNDEARKLDYRSWSTVYPLDFPQEGFMREMRRRTPPGMACPITEWDIVCQRCGKEVAGYCTDTCWNERFLEHRSNSCVEGTAAQPTADALPDKGHGAATQHRSAWKGVGAGPSAGQDEKDQDRHEAESDTDALPASLYMPIYRTRRCGAGRARARPDGGEISGSGVCGSGDAVPKRVERRRCRRWRWTTRRADRGSPRPAHARAPRKYKLLTPDAALCARAPVRCSISGSAHAGDGDARTEAREEESALEHAHKRTSQTKTNRARPRPHTHALPKSGFSYSPDTALRRRPCARARRGNIPRSAMRGPAGTVQRARDSGVRCTETRGEASSLDRAQDRTRKTTREAEADTDVLPFHNVLYTGYGAMRTRARGMQHP
ncbi:hypothetical protein HYPSUDRAFT_209054 [Hypholoma sublateritium FD-334 SS-4]|uniref:Uncharacterized protein n=1 Tax=Hypholoma sublateritium (strain FD-334 SS-4) TaxID=945553 RepID=A0A0D2LT70_HYPSF|nr:hypothetical protein HYPSUDRAFT_209054 [Hypholoma sublateritium FD-334 SS-4]